TCSRPGSAGRSHAEAKRWPRSVHRLWAVLQYFRRYGNTAIQPGATSATSPGPLTDVWRSGRSRQPLPVPCDAVDLEVRLGRPSMTLSPHLQTVRHTAPHIYRTRAYAAIMPGWRG